MRVGVQVRYAGQVLDAVQETQDAGRDLAVHEPVYGDGGMALDRGPRLRRTRLRIEWLARDSADDVLARRNEFLSVVDGQRHLYQSPLDGTWFAVVNDVHHSLEAGIATSDVDLMEDQRDQSNDVVSSAAGVLARAGAQSVSVAAIEVSALLAEMGEPVAVADNAVSLAESWELATQADTLSARDVYADLQAQTTAIDGEARRLNVSENLDRYRLHIALYILSHELRRAAETATADTAHTFEVRVLETTSLLALCDAIYGGSNAIDRYRQVRALQRIDTPLAIPAGTVLLAPVVTA